MYIKPFFFFFATIKCKLFILFTLYLLGYKCPTPINKNKHIALTSWLIWLSQTEKVRQIPYISNIYKGCKPIY